MSRSQFDAGTLEVLVWRTLLETSFLFAARAVGPPREHDDDLCVSVAFEGPDDGRLCVRAARGLGAVLAGAFLHLRPDDPESVSFAENAVSEFTNILAGALVNRAYGSQVAYNLGTPVANLPSSPSEEVVSELRVMVEELYPLRVTVLMQA